MYLSCLFSILVNLKVKGFFALCRRVIMVQNLAVAATSGHAVKKLFRLQTLDAHADVRSIETVQWTAVITVSGWSMSGVTSQRCSGPLAGLSHMPSHFAVSLAINSNTPRIATSTLYRDCYKKLVYN